MKVLFTLCIPALGKVGLLIDNVIFLCNVVYMSSVYMYSMCNTVPTIWSLVQLIENELTTFKEAIIFMFSIINDPVLA